MFTEETMSADTSPAALRGTKRWLRVFCLAAAGIAVIATAAVVRYSWPAQEASAQSPAGAADPAAALPRQKLAVVAVVNGEEIGRELLARDCLRRYGADVLDSLINKQLILDYCQRTGIAVSQQEVEAEILRMAQQFKIPADQYLQMLQKERGISPEQYAEDIILPTLALRKVAKEKLKVTPEETQAAYETQFGPQVETRMIVCSTHQKAQELLAKVKSDPNSFGKIAKEYSDDVPSARNEGIVLPIRRHLGDANIERAAFALKPGQISEIIPLGEKNQAGRQYVIIKCERQVADRFKEFPLQGEVKQRIEHAVRERKEAVMGREIFDKLRKEAQIVRVFGDDDASRQYPGVAASVGQRTIGLEELAEECIRRHGVEVLEGTISRRILEQQARSSGIQVSQQDIDAEVVRAAKAMGVLTKNGQPDIKTWLGMVEKDQGLTPERYVDDIVWPTAALKAYVHKTVPGGVHVSEEDLQKGYDASFGPRVKCTAIVLNNQRTADEVWNLCRQQQADPIFFGQMSHKYSVDAQTRQLMGDVPPIQKHGGRPLLEKAAFELKQGEMSGIIQVGDKFVILLCLGHTKSEQVNFEQVKQEIYDDLFEKKMRLEMAKVFDQMMESSRIENFLANTRQTPKPPRTSNPKSQSVPRRR
jgi:parvulin-like peptidyl-prolyl isomerase